MYHMNSHNIDRSSPPRIGWIHSNILLIWCNHVHNGWHTDAHNTRFLCWLLNILSVQFYFYNYKHMSKRMPNERFIKWSYYFLYQRNMTIPARGHKAYRAWDTVMTYNYHAFISCLVISLITSAWKKTASALTVSETTNNLHNIINF